MRARMPRRGGWLKIASFVVIVLLILVTLHSADKAQTNRKLANAQTTLPPLPTLVDQPVLAAKPTNPDFQAKAGVLIDVDSGEVLFAQNAQTPLPIASTTKLMTALLARKYLNVDQVITVTDDDRNVIGSAIGLHPNEKISVQNLLVGLLLVSGNDAAQTLARLAGGTKEHFVELMNQQAKDLGLVNTHYYDPAGLDDQGHSTAYELAMIARADLQDPLISKIMKTPNETVTSADGQFVHTFKNSNRLVGEFNYPGALGFKTGYTPDAGHCLVGGAERDGHRLIAVVLNTASTTPQASAFEARKLLDWGWQNVTWQNPLTVPN